MKWWWLARQVCFFITISATLSAGAANAWTLGDLPAELVKELKRQGMLTNAVAIPRFQWVLEQQRPLRKPRTVTEQFQASADGLSFVQSSTRSSDGKVELRDYASARGLLRYTPSDTQADVQFEGLTFPLYAGRQFRWRLTRDEIPLNQTCHVLDKNLARHVHSAMPGDAWRIQCEGESRYSGMKVKVSSVLYFIEKLGVFFNEKDDLKSPLGKFSFSQRIVHFQLL